MYAYIPVEPYNYWNALKMYMYSTNYTSLLSIQTLQRSVPKDLHEMIVYMIQLLCQ